MKRTCFDCGCPLLVKNTAREHTDWRTGETFYRCRECAERRVRAVGDVARALHEADFEHLAVELEQVAAAVRAWRETL